LQQHNQRDAKPGSTYDKKMCSASKHVLCTPLSLPACLQYTRDPEPIVAHSCEVALDMLEFERSGAFQYADDGN
jgi:hypothetical protein